MASTGQDDDDDRFLSRREADVLMEAYNRAFQQHIDSHGHAHDAQKEIARLEMVAATQAQALHLTAHIAAAEAHDAVHTEAKLGITTALDAVARERQIHADAHVREHQGHQREHELDKLAITKAEGATDIRFNAANGTREQLDTYTRTLATKETVDGNQRRTDQRIDDAMTRIVNIEKGDVKQEGRSLGQGTTIAIIVGSIALVGTLLGILVTVMNLVT